MTEKAPIKKTLNTHDGIFYYPKSLKPENNIDIEGMMAQVTHRDQIWTDGSIKEKLLEKTF